jgi:RNA exonuclease 4
MNVLALAASIDTTQCICIDVECVATGTKYDDRAVARVAVVDWEENIIFDRMVKPDLPVVSHLTALTGIEPGQLDEASPLSDIIAELKTACLNPMTVIVGQSISKDIEWLGLVEGVDFAYIFDIAHLFRIPRHPTDPRAFQSPFIYVNLRHECLVLLNVDIQAGAHSPVVDAVYSMRLFTTYQYVSSAELDDVHSRLLNAPRTISFANMYPVYDGVEMKKPYAS